MRGRSAVQEGKMAKSVFVQQMRREYPMYISQFDWLEEKTYHYFRWSSTFDSYSLNMILLLNPKRNQYNIPENALPKSISGFGTGIQFMFIYNH